MEQLILPEYESVVLTGEQLEAFQNDTIDIETEYLDGEECLYVVGIRGTIIDNHAGEGQVTEFFIYTSEYVEETKETMNRIYFFNSLDGAFDCYKAIRDKYKLVEAENNSTFEKKQRQEALNKFIS